MGCVMVVTVKNAASCVGGVYQIKFLEQNPKQSHQPLPDTPARLGVGRVHGWGIAERVIGWVGREGGDSVPGAETMRQVVGESERLNESPL